MHQKTNNHQSAISNPHPRQSATFADKNFSSFVIRISSFHLCALGAVVVKSNVSHPVDPRQSCDPVKKGRENIATQNFRKTRPLRIFDDLHPKNRQAPVHLVNNFTAAP
jgi:hypothetical protein